ncbi:dual oxidase maturation factor 1 [Caerostris extrusa]|uniref:Dual oxidase maturation factor 1 n=1 Tax=Caerostris extrusa TaxID=172846 RepID=A0AAV4QVD9_CAEEX|nr:dual oxidase maturation factor 1 [Caerostris extrusa]
MFGAYSARDRVQNPCPCPCRKRERIIDRSGITLPVSRMFIPTNVNLGDVYSILRFRIHTSRCHPWEGGRGSKLRWRVHTNICQSLGILFKIANQFAYQQMPPLGGFCSNCDGVCLPTSSLFGGGIVQYCDSGRIPTDATLGTTEMKQEYRDALVKGLPFPLLTIAEYFTQELEGFCWGRRYRLAGYYSYILLW